MEIQQGGENMNKVFIIAEAGVNHNGSVEVAKKLIDEAVIAGADAVKFQTFKAENLVTKNAKQAKYQVRNLSEETSQFEMLKKLELDYAEYRELVEYCKKRHIMFLSSPFDIESIEFLDNLGIEVFKIPSGEIENVPYLEKVARIGKKIILSTGMSDLSDIEFVDVGYSDHTEGIEVSIAAVAMGAKVIEKHFTLDKTMEGPDHLASLNPDELRMMIKSIRNIEKALGDGIKYPTTVEKENKKIVRKSIVASVDIKCGEVFTEKNLTVKRPASGINPKMWHAIIGMVSKKDYRKDDLIQW